MTSILNGNEYIRWLMEDLEPTPNENLWQRIVLPEAWYANFDRKRRRFKKIRRMAKPGARLERHIKRPIQQKTWHPLPIWVALQAYQQKPGGVSKSGRPENPRMGLWHLGYAELLWLKIRSAILMRVRITTLRKEESRWWRCGPRLTWLVTMTG